LSEQASAASRRTAPRRYLGSFLLLLASLIVGLVLVEVATRIVDDLPATGVVLPERVAARGNDTTSLYFDGVARAAGTSRELYLSDPPPLPNRTKPPAEWIALRRQIGNKPVFGALAPDNPFQPWDMFKAWNSAFVGDPCQHPYLRGAPGRLFVYDPPEGYKRPTFRFLPDATTPLGLVTNAFGWRGRPVPFRRAADTVRIVFVGASTTVEHHGYPFSGAEHVDHWLNRWAAGRDLRVRFEVLNAARESMSSQDSAAIIRQEVAPLRPDLVFYYEGGNQLDLSTMVRLRPAGTPQPDGRLAQALRTIAPYSALARRAEALTGGREWPKPDYELVWPQGLDEFDPDITRSDLPINLDLVMPQLEAMRTELAAIGSAFAIGSFHWLAKDGLVLDAVRHKPILQNLNVGYFPFRYRDLERMTAFENRVFAKYAAARGLPLIDVARYMPSDPDLFADAMHNTPAGVRLRAWIVFQQLLPIIESRLASGAWPREPPEMGDTHPAFAIKPRTITFDCKAS
jgi:hypothetical protein